MVIKLSDTLPDTPSSNLVCNVHGVRSEFLGIGASASKRTDAGKGDEVWTQGAYFLGKALYTKGYVDGGHTFGFWGVCARPANIRRSPWTAHGGHVFREVTENSSTRCWRTRHARWPRGRTRCLR